LHCCKSPIPEELSKYFFTSGMKIWISAIGMALAVTCSSFTENTKTVSGTGMVIDDTVTFKATFVRKGTEEYRGYVYIPATNWFRVLSVSGGEIVEKMIEVERGGKGIKNFAIGGVYNITAVRIAGRSTLINVLATAESYN